MQPAAPWPPHRWLPAAFVATARRVTLRSGLASVVLGVAMALAVPILGYALPTAYDPTTVVTVGLGVLVAYALLISGIGLLVARSFVALGYLAHRKEYSALAPQLGTCVPAWLATCGFVPWYLLTVTTSGDSSGHDQLPFTAPIVIYTVLPVAASLLITANLVTVFALFFPSQRRLAEYTARPT